MTVTVVNGQQTKLTGLPERWEETRMKAAVGRYQLKKNADPKPVVLSLTKTGVKVKTDLAFGKSTENYVGHQIVEPGQFVFTPRDFDATPILCGISPTMGCISNLYLVFDVSQDFNPRFLEYYFWGLKWGYDYFAQLSYGMRYSFNQETFERIPLAKPTIEEQDAVVRFLDRETGLIDGLIEKKTRFIALLKEKRAAVITHAVTKGIDPDAPMKDSGVDWLGRVPAHWEVVPATALFTVSGERAREGDQMLSATQKYGVIPLADYEALEQRQVTMAVVNLNMRKHVEVGDFVISMRSMDGGLERARAVGSVRSSYSVLKPGPDVEGRFYGALMKSSLYIQALRLTSNFIRDGQDLNFGHVRKVKLPKPDIHEQVAIADHIEAETSRIDGLITLTERSIDLLREKRAALITAAVTGKIDVRAAA